MTVTGGGFPLDVVDLFLDQATGAPLATTDAGYFGGFSNSVTIPKVSAGSHTLIAVTPDGIGTETTINVS